MTVQYLCPGHYSQHILIFYTKPPSEVEVSASVDDSKQNSEIGGHYGGRHHKPVSFSGDDEVPYMTFLTRRFCDTLI